jgi:hypothetical protein
MHAWAAWARWWRPDPCTMCLCISMVQELKGLLYGKFGNSINLEES